MSLQVFQLPIQPRNSGSAAFRRGKCVVQLNGAPGPVIQFPLVGFARKEAVQGCVGNKGWLVESVDKEAIYDVGLVSQRIQPAGDSLDASYLTECEQFAFLICGVDGPEDGAVVEEHLVLCGFFDGQLKGFSRWRLALPLRW